MKVTITADMKKAIAISDMPAVNKVIRSAKEDEMTIKEYAERAASIACADGFGHNVKVLETSAELACNCRIYDWYDNGSEHFDIWINFTAIIDNGFGGIIMGGAYVTDIHASTGENYEELRNHMYIRKFTENK